MEYHSHLLVPQNYIHKGALAKPGALYMSVEAAVAKTCGLLHLNMVVDLVDAL